MEIKKQPYASLALEIIEVQMENGYAVSGRNLTEGGEWNESY